MSSVWRIGTALIVLFTAAGTMWYAHTTTPVAPLDASPARVAQLQERIRRMGPESAYAHFVSEVRRAPEGTHHTQAHYFGTALYREEGLEGFAVCDTTFNYGCYHEFIGNAIAEHGEAAILLLNEKCRELGPGYLACQHGIGHGIVSHVGYEADTLTTAIRLCDEVVEDPIGGCYGGLFMEYNMRTMWGSDAEFRPLAESPFVPCTLVKKETQVACIYWQPQWWNMVLAEEKSSPAIFARMGTLCRQASERMGIYRECFEGIGNIAPYASGFTVEKARVLCDSAKSTSEEYLWCISVVANHFSMIGLDKGGARVCKGLAGDDAAVCRAWGRNEFNIVFHE